MKKHAILMVFCLILTGNLQALISWISILLMESGVIILPGRKYRLNGIMRSLQELINRETEKMALY